MLGIAGKQSIGKRDNQEDCFRLILQDERDPHSDALMILSDGMGGHAGGEVASNLVSDRFAAYFVSNTSETRPSSRLRASLAAANEALAARVAEEPALNGMGCTLIGALKVDKRLIWISVGDSVLFLLRDGKLRRLNQDHSVYGELKDLVRAGKLTQQEADRNPRRNALRSAVLGREIALIDVDSITLKKGDIILLATDGVETLSDHEIEVILKREKQPDMRAVTADLINAVNAKQMPKQDNTSLIAYHHSGGHDGSTSGHSEWSLMDERQAPGGLPMRMVIPAALGLILFIAMMAIFWGVSGGDPTPLNTAGTDAPEIAQPDTGTTSPPQRRLIDEGSGGAGDNAISDPDETEVERAPGSGFDRETDGQLDGETGGEIGDGSAADEDLVPETGSGSEIPQLNAPGVGDGEISDPAPGAVPNDQRPLESPDTPAPPANPDPDAGPTDVSYSLPPPDAD